MEVFGWILTVIFLLFFAKCWWFCFCGYKAPVVVLTLLFLGSLLLRM